MQGQNAQNSVIIKGVREGLLFILDDDVPFAQVLTELSERINTKPDFFRGAGVTINAGRRVMEQPDFDVVYRMLAEGYGVPSRPPSFAAGDAGGSLGLKGRGTPGALAAPAPSRDSSDSVAEAGEGLFLRCNLRPGQWVRYAGDVCVLGDVEAGADVVANGDIVVWGALLGTAHAGADGDDEAVVCALRLSPQQLGIAGYISRFPPTEPGSPAPQPPEMAKVEAGRIVVEAWNGD